MSQTKAQLISDLVQALAFVGTASAPTNGIYLSATNTLSFATNSTERLSVDANGNLVLKKELRLEDDDGSNYVGFKAAATVSANQIWTLPAADGTNGQALVTDGSGNFSFADSGGASAINDLSDAITNSSGVTIGLGTGALANDDGTTNNNTALGYNALNDLTNGSNNIAVGYEAGGTILSGLANVAVGHEAMATVGTSTLMRYNVGIGYQALYRTTTSNNLAIGYRPLYNCTSGNLNLACGYLALYSLTTGTFNTGIHYALKDCTTGQNNIGIGYLAGGKVTTGTTNVFVGRSAGSDSTTGTTTGSNNTVIGYNANPSGAGVSNEITLGNTSVTSFRIPGIQSGATAIVTGKH